MILSVDSVTNHERLFVLTAFVPDGFDKAENEIVMHLSTVFACTKHNHEKYHTNHLKREPTMDHVAKFQVTVLEHSVQLVDVHLAYLPIILKKMHSAPKPKIRKPNAAATASILVKMVKEY
jgi:hypothetical protein